MPNPPRMAMQGRAAMTPGREARARSLWKPMRGNLTEIRGEASCQKPPRRAVAALKPMSCRLRARSHDTGEGGSCQKPPEADVAGKLTEARSVWTVMIPRETGLFRRARRGVDGGGGERGGHRSCGECSGPT